MQQQQPSIKIIPKAMVKDPAWVNIALVIGGILLVVVLVPFFLSRGKVAELTDREESLDNQITGLITKYSQMSRDLAVVAAKIDDFSGLFRDHRVVSGIFSFFGSLCHPLTQFTDFSFSDQDFRVIIDISTENFRTLGEQFLIFEENEFIHEPEISGIHLNKEGFVNAQFNFILDKALIMPFSESVTKPTDATSTSTPSTTTPL